MPETLNLKKNCYPCWEANMETIFINIFYLSMYHYTELMASQANPFLYQEAYLLCIIYKTDKSNTNGTEWD